MDGRSIVERLGPKHADEFHQEFVSLKHRTHDSPKVFRREALRKWDVLEQAWRVFRRAEWIEAYEKIGKRAIVAPKESLRAWEAFKAEWREAIAETLWYGVSKRREIAARSIVDALIEDQSESLEFDGYNGWIKLQGQMYRAPPIQLHDDDLFDPEYDDPISLIESAIYYFSNNADEFEDAGNSTAQLEAMKIDGAWAYLQYALGLDHANLWNRWKLKWSPKIGQEVKL